MTKRNKWLVSAAFGLPLAYHVLIGFGAADAAEPVARAVVTNPAGPVPTFADKEAFFGDLHLHTTNSFDAYVLMGTRTTPEDAYRFASGETIDYLGQPIRRSFPLDFEAVTDHSENLGVFNQLDDPQGAFSLSEVGKLARKGGVEAFMKIVKMMTDGVRLGDNASSVSASTWRREKDTANHYYQPGKFTTFIAYEWTSMPGGQNLHRNVIFKGSDAPAPFTSIDSKDPRDLWTWLSKIRTQGFEAIAIPHNGNASNGLMYDWTSLDGKPIDEAYAQLRAANEPLSEVSQNKGTSETHPALSANDEFANYELFDKLLIGTQASKPAGSYWRDALGRGLVLQQKLGVNPYKDGAEGSSDLHGGLQISTAQEYSGIASANLGGGRLNKDTAEQALGLKPSGLSAGLNPVVLSPGALTGVWAESNTREAIYDAFRRKETYATSGSRLKVRFFGGWDFGTSFVAKPGWVHEAYRLGVPMGGDLPTGASGRAPSFVVQAVKDPLSGNLDRVQVVKVYVENGRQQEKIFDIAWSGARKIDPATGKLAPVGSTVDLKTGKWDNSIGAAELATVWTDPTFKADQPAAYYVRVLEIPTPRWSTLRALEFGLPLPKEVAPTIQQRAWSSPIWYTPPRSRG